MTDFPKIIENLNNEGLLHERILGGKGQRNAIANFYELYPEIFQNISVYLLHNFITLNNFTKEQYEAYHQAVTDFGKVIESCKAERDEENKEISKEQ